MRRLTFSDTKPMRTLSAMLAASMLVLTACSGGASQDTGPVPEAGVAQSGLETTALTITQGATVHRFTVELARTEAQQAAGLMYRTSLPAEGGMLFPFPSPKIASFWMKNTLIPLDILFIRQDGSIDRIAENTIPESLEPVASGSDVLAVLELAGGTAARLNINETAIVRWEGDSIQR